MKYNNPTQLSRDEYLFLSEKFEMMTADDVKELPKYIVNMRQQNFERVMKLAIENELDETEKKYINDKYFLLMRVGDIARKYSVSRQSVYRVLEKASKKLYENLKYVYCCGFTLINPPANLEELLKSTTRRN